MSTSVPIEYGDLESALHWSSSGLPVENQAQICRRTGRVYLKSMYGNFEEEELPEDIDDESQYVTVPHKNELNLGRDLVFEFVENEEPQIIGAVQAAFRQRGAYAKFKDILDRKGMLQRWYDYEAAATRLALERWAEKNDIVVTGSSRGGATR